MERHQAVREHLRVDAEVALLAVGEPGGNRGGDGSDAGLEGRPVGHERGRVLGDLEVGLRRLDVGQGERRALALDQDVDLVDLQGVQVLGRHAEGARVVGRGLHHEQTLRVGRRADHLGGRAAGVKGERAPALGVGRGGGGRHHARALFLEQRGEAAEVRGRERDVRARIAERPLERAEEA